MKSKVRVLIVDDDQDTRWHLMQSFFRHQMLCESAENGEIAYNLLQQDHFDIVVTDLKMPKVNGHVLVKKILDLKKPPMVIVITGVTNLQIIDELILMGVDDVIIKPFDMVTNVQKIVSFYKKSTIGAVA